MKAIKHKRFFIPDNILELFFGLGILGSEKVNAGERFPEM